MNLPEPNREIHYEIRKAGWHQYKLLITHGLSGHYYFRTFFSEEAALKFAMKEAHKMRRKDEEEKHTLKGKL